MTLTTEQLKHILDNPNEFSLSQVQEMAAELLANREAQPVGYTSKRNLANVTGRHLELFSKDSAVYSDPVALYTAPPAPANARAVAWEMRYWNSGHNMWHDWERITAEQHAEMSVLHAADNDYEFRVLYDATPAPAVPEEISSSIRHLKDTLVACNRFNYCADAVNRVEDACRAAMLKGERP